MVTVVKKKIDGNTKPGNDDLSAQVKQLSEAVVLLMKNQEGMQTSMTSISDSIKTLGSVSAQQTEAQKQQQIEDKAKAEADTLAASQLDNAELENLDRAGFLDHIMGEINKSISGLSDGLNNKLSAITERSDTDDTKAELASVQKAHKDFTDWIPEIQQIIKESQGISLSRAYKLARDENPDKAKEVDEMYRDKGNNDGDAKGLKQTGFGGLTPTSGVQTDVPTDMTQDNAVEAAWSETMDGMDLESGS